MEQTSKLKRWGIVGLLLLLGPLLAFGWSRFVPKKDSVEDLRTLSWSIWEAPTSNWRSLTVRHDFCTTGDRRGSIDFGPLESGFLELRLYVAANSSCQPDWVLAWVPVSIGDPAWEKYLLDLEAFLNTNRLRGEVQSWGSGFRVVWRLPQLVRKARIGLPRHSELRIVRVEAVIPGDARAWQVEAIERRTQRLQGMVLAGACFILAGMVLQLSIFDTQALSGLLLAATLASFLVTVFWLPPFQGPDEQDHWRDALARYRRNAVQEKLLYNLPEITGFDRVRWRAEEHVSPTLFRQMGTEIEPIREPKWVNYTGYYSYPAVAIVAWLFPAVQTVQEALLFYYLCRLVPVSVLALLLYWAWREETLPAIALAVLSSPYVQQQCVIISTDTLANLAGLGAGLCWLALQKRWSWGLYGTLWLAATLCFLAKPPIYVLVFALPLWATPWRRLPMRLWLLLGLVMLLGAVVLALVLRAYQAMHRVPVAEQFHQQWHFFFYEGGWRYFLGEPLRTAFTIPRRLQNWFMPLGWVDTSLQPYHIGFLRQIVIAAAFTDILRALVRVPAWCEGKHLVHLGIIAIYLTVIFLGTWTLTAIVMYLAVTPPRHPFIYGMQVRYLFPCLLLGLWLPLGAVRAGIVKPIQQANTSANGNKPAASTSETSDPASPWQVWLNWAERLVMAWWTATFLLMTVGRLVGLVGDLLARYW